MLQQQIELGRIILPPDLDAEAGAAAGKAPGSPAPPSPEAVGRQMEWLLAAHRGARMPAAVDAASPAAPAGDAPEQPEQPLPAAGEQQGGSVAASEGAAAEAEAEADARVREQLAGISRSLWATLSAGGASGHGTYTSRSQADFAFKADAVAAMRAGGELDSTHHHRRDGHSAYVEASARDAVLRRGGHAKPADQ